MPHFYNFKQKYFISTNFKVMYSTFRKQEYLKKVKLFRLLFSSKNKYIVVRNPYDRLESFYRDKLGKSLLLEKKWLRSQKIYFKPLGVNSKSREEKFKALQKMSFEEFIKLLPLTYQKNRHLHLQNKIFKNIKPKRVIQMEKTEDLFFMQTQLQLDMNIKANKTDKQSEIIWSPEMIDIVNTVYKADFEQYGYLKKEN